MGVVRCHSPQRWWASPPRRSFPGTGHSANARVAGGRGRSSRPATTWDVRDLELWWTTSNTTKDAQRATWSLGLVLQFVNG